MLGNILGGVLACSFAWIIGYFVGGELGQMFQAMGVIPLMWMIGDIVKKKVGE